MLSLVHASQLALGIHSVLKPRPNITTASITHLAGVMLAVLPAPTLSPFEQPIYIISLDIMFWNLKNKQRIKPLTFGGGLLECFEIFYLR